MRLWALLVPAHLGNPVRTKLQNLRRHEPDLKLVSIHELEGLLLSHELTGAAVPKNGVGKPGLFAGTPNVRGVFAAVHGGF